MVCFVRIVYICFMDEAVFTSSLPTVLHLTPQTFGEGGVLAITLGCLSQLSLGFKFNQFHQIFNHHITVKFLALVFSERTLTLNMDESVCSFSYLGRGMESHDLFRSWMIREKLCNFSSGLCFEKHSHFLLLQQRMSCSNALHGSFLTVHQKHIIEEAALQKHCEDEGSVSFVLGLPGSGQMASNCTTAGTSRMGS